MNKFQKNKSNKFLTKIKLKKNKKNISLIIIIYNNII